MSDTSTTTMTGLTGAGGGDMLRILGMNTGLDVDSIVTKMMKGEQTKIDRAKQAEQLVEWKQEAYQSIIADVKTFQNKYFDVLNKDTYVLSPDFFSSCTASSADESMVTAQAGVGAQAGTYKIDFLSGDHIASAATKNGIDLNAKYAGSGLTISNSTTMSQLGLTSNGTIVLNYNGQSASIDVNTTDKLSDVINNISTKTNGNVTANFSQLTGQFTIKTSNTGSSQSIQFGSSSSDNVLNSLGLLDAVKTGNELSTNDGSSLSVTTTTMSQLGLASDTTLILNCNSGNDIAINIRATDKLSDVINKISNLPDRNVMASFDESTRRITLKAAQSIQVKSDLPALGLTADDAPVIGTTATGSDAKLHITPPGGSAVAVTKSTNTFAIDGITYNLLSSEDMSTSSTSITVKQDADKTYDRINDFIQSYDKIADEIQEKLGEKKDKNYPPLTDAQKKTMNDDQIKDWNNKAKAGVLRNDDNLEKMLDDFRNAFTTAVDGDTLKFGRYGTNAIGIDTDYDTSLTDLSGYQVSKDSSSSDSSYVVQGGKIQIADKTKLMDAIKNHSDELAKFFTATSDSDDKTQKYKEEGVISRLSDIFDNNVGGVGTTLNSAVLTKYANNRDDHSLYGNDGDNTLPDQIAYKQKAVSNLQSEYKTMQESYYEKFSKLETAMQTLNTQQSMLSMMLGQSS